jgi:hypothetical protein
MKGPAISKPRDRVLSEDEIRQLWLRSSELGVECERIVKLCLVTAQRLGEVVGIQRTEVDLTRRVWNIPGARTKNGHPHSVPLSRMALNLIGDRDGFDISRGAIIARGDPPDWLLRALEIPHLGIDENYHAIMPDISREESEALVIECWRRFRGSVERSDELYEVCRVYWGVCGGKDFPPFDEWRLPDEERVRDIIERER